MITAPPQSDRTASSCWPERFFPDGGKASACSASIAQAPCVAFINGSVELLDYTRENDEWVGAW